MSQMSVHMGLAWLKHWHPRTEPHSLASFPTVQQVQAGTTHTPVIVRKSVPKS